MLRNWLVVLLVCLALSGCKSPVLLLDDPALIDGVYRSAAAVGQLGTLELTIRKRPRAVRVYESVLSSDSSAIADTEGRGTLGNDHLILNFDIGETDDFYFQGFRQQDTAGTVTGLTGTFIFPGQDEQLPVEFTWISDAPPLEDEAT